jgi:hypothetical protein
MHVETKVADHTGKRLVMCRQLGLGMGDCGHE